MRCSAVGGPLRRPHGVLGFAGSQATGTYLQFDRYELQRYTLRRVGSEEVLVTRSQDRASASATAIASGRHRGAKAGAVAPLRTVYTRWLRHAAAPDLRRCTKGSRWVTGTTTPPSSKGRICSLDGESTTVAMCSSTASTSDRAPAREQLPQQRLVAADPAEPEDRPPLGARAGLVPEQGNLLLV